MNHSPFSEGSDERLLPASPLGWAKILITWVIVIAILIVVGDLPLVPFVLGAKALFGLAVAAVVGFALSFGTQWVVIWQTLKEPEDQWRLYSKLLSALGLSPGNESDSFLAKRQNQLAAQITSSGTALLATFALGGVAPIVVLRRLGFPVPHLRKLGIATATIWASCFVAIWVFGVNWIF